MRLDTGFPTNLVLFQGTRFSTLTTLALTALIAMTLIVSGCGAGGGTTTAIAAQNQPPVAKMSITVTSGVAPLAVTVTSTGSADPDGSIASTSIDFGDGTVVSGASASHTFTNAGTYTVKVTVTDNAGASTTTTSTVTVTAAANQPPVARLTVTPTSGIAPVTVTASATSSSDPDGTIASTSINFGDGTTINTASGTHTYSAAGTYTLRATVTDNQGASSSTTATVTVSTATNQPPVARLTVTPTSGVAPLAVTASAATSSDPDGTIASFSINFGDGTTISTASGSHTYSAAGTYTVTATVADNAGAKSSITATVTVTAAANQPPVARLTVTPTSGTAPLAITASATTSSDPDGTIASTSINFGDGTTINTASGAHTYSAAGTYTVRATVTDNQGASSSATATVTVTAAANQPPVARLTVTPTSGTAPLAVTASAAASSDPDGTIASTSINFGDGTTINTASGSHTYSAAGSYTVTATVTDNAGTSSSTTATVTASAPASGTQIYVDNTLASASCTTYNISARNCTGGTATAYNSLAGAEAAASAGTTVWVRAGTFSAQWVLGKNGTAGNPITWKAYTGETVTLNNSADRSFVISGRSYITLDGFTVSNPGGLGLVYNSNNIVLQNFTFTPGSNGASGRTGSLWFDRVTYSKVLNSNWTNALGFDGFYSELSDHNLFAGNTFAGATHTVFNISCGNYNVIRNNIFYSPTQKIGETFDCELGDSQGATIPNAQAYNNTHHNFWEANEFRQTAANGSKYNANGVQYCGQEGVVRNNIFYNNLGGGVSFQSYANECNITVNNRVYNNTFYKNHCFGINAVGTSSTNYTGNILKNNLLYQNSDCSGAGSAQIELDDASATNCNGTNSCSNGNNVITATDPKFVNATTVPYDLHVQTGSVAIDAGTWLSTASGAGTASKTLVVADARYFRDGLGITGEQGDLIQLQGQSTTARIVSINYSTNTLTLDTALTWASGAGVALAFSGTVPDAGAYESGSTTTPPPAPLASSLSIAPSSGQAPLAVTFTLNTTGGTAPYVNTFVYGDGTSGTSATHTYSAAGSYAVSVTVMDANSAIVSVGGTVTATAAANQPPVARVTATPTSGAAPLAVTASAATSTDPDGTIATTSINFGDGTTVTAVSGSHSYTAAGTYTITATVTDNLGASSSATATVTVTSATPPPPIGNYPPAGLLGSQSFVLPIGMPMPSFGVAETAPAYPSPWDATHTTSGGYQFYYVCPGCTGATDTSNAFGYPGKGRSTIPATMTGPAVVVLGTAGQTINLNLANTTWAGTAAAPIFVRSFDTTNPVWITAPQAALTSGDRYTIFEYLRFKPATATTTDWGMYLIEGVDHISIRYSEFAGSTSSSSSGFGMGTWTYSGSQVVDNAVLLSTYIHDQYDINAGGDPDDHCVTLNGAVRNTWVLYNEMARCAGDGIQIEAQHGNMGRINHIYVGKNFSHGNRQSAFWIKHATDVIFSQNKADSNWGNAANGDPGICYGGQYSPVRSWFLYNECSNSNIGLAVSSDDGDAGSDMYFIGNWVHDLNAISTGVYDAGAVRCESQANVYIVNNLFYQTTRSLNFLPGCGNTRFAGNIVSTQAIANYDIYTEGGTTMSFTNNIFSASPRFTDGTSTYTTCAGLSNLGTSSGCSTTQPTFVNAAGYDFRLATGSAGIDGMGATNAVYATFQTLYGLSIQYDPNGTARPLNSLWDIGPYEYNSAAPAIAIPTLQPAVMSSSTTDTTTTSSASFSSLNTTSATSNSGKQGGKGNKKGSNQAPTAVIAVTPTSGYAPTVVNVSTAGSTDPDGSITATTINFGDGAILSAASGSHTYTVAGTYTVTATVTDNLGASASAASTVTVIAPNQAPLAQLTVTPTSASAPAIVTASALDSSDPDGSIVSTSIDFGDGTVINAATGTHTYNNGGTYTVKATVTDNQGAVSSTTQVVVVTAATAVSNGWQAPIGIPEPSFGINEVAPPRPNPWTAEVTGYYYVQNDAVGCSDARKYGTPGMPRCTIPNPVPAGAVVEVHGIYNRDHGDSNRIQSNGTSAAPVFIRGLDNAENRPTIAKGLAVFGSYAIVENMNFDHTAVTQSGGGVTIGLPNGDSAGTADCSTQKRSACADHISFRHNELHGYTGSSAFNACGNLNVGGWTTDLPPGSSQNNVVFWDNSVHDEGQMSPLTDNDQACTALNVGRYASHVWIVDNNCNNVAQSCVQIVPTNDGSAYNETHHVYVGRNVSNRASKNAFWVKAASDVVFSQNIAHDTIEKTYNPSTGFGLQYGPQRVWFLYNEAYNVTGGIWMASDNNGGPDQRYYLIGNRIHDITNAGSYFPTWNPADLWSAAAIFDASGAEVHSVNNTIWRLNQANGMNKAVGGGTHEFVNNIVGGFLQTLSRGVYYESSSEFSASSVDFNDISPMRWQVGGTMYTTLGTLQGTGKCAHCLAVDPAFADVVGGDWHLQSASPVIDRGTASSVYDTFLNLYGIDIKKDADDKLRPQGAGWDMGAYER